MNKTTKLSEKHILIIGGMGPQASLYAHKLVIDEAAKKGAVNNDDFPMITHLSINVVDFISQPQKKLAALKHILACLSTIDLSSLTGGLIACNTVHILFDDIQKQVPFELTSLVDTVIKNIKEEPGITTAGILSTLSTKQLKIYEDKLPKNIKLTYPSEIMSKKVDGTIRKVIRGDNLDKLASELDCEISTLHNQGVEKIIAGCTELSLINSVLKNNRIIDPLELAVKELLL